MEPSVAIANEFLKRAGKAGLTQMQIQKLVYIAHGWNLALSDAPLTSDLPQAWNYGPVYADLYDHTKFFGRGQINRPITPDDNEAMNFFIGAPSVAKPYRASLSERETAIIDRVWHRYGHMTGAQLSALTHRPDTPWERTYRSGAGRKAPIANDLIKHHYDQLAAAAAG